MAVPAASLIGDPAIAVRLNDQLMLPEPARYRVCGSGPDAPKPFMKPRRPERL